MGYIKYLLKNILRSFLYYGYITYLCDADTAAFALAVILPYNILILFTMNQNLNVSAKTFVQVINEGRQKQSDLYGRWFSSKETGEQLIRKAQQYLDAYRKYVEYLEKVVELNPRDLDMELNLSKFDSILQDASPEVREAFLSKYRN